MIENFIQLLAQSGTDTRRVVLVGFSQGAAMSMMISLNTRHNLGGVVNLSGWTPPRAGDVRQSYSENGRRFSLRC